MRRKSTGPAAGLLALMSILACQHSDPQVPTPYQPLDAHGGYTDVPLPDGRWLVSFRANGWTLPEDVRAMARRRAGEICPKGYDALSEENVSPAETADDQSRCILIYDSAHCGTHHGESVSERRWQITFVCK
jgi:hypothetical protein